MKNVGVPDTPDRSADSTSWATRVSQHVPFQFGAEPVGVQSERLCVPAQVHHGQRVLMQQVVHGPERALGGSRLGRSAASWARGTSVSGYAATRSGWWCR